MTAKFWELAVHSEDVARAAADDGAFFAEIVDEMVVEYGLRTLVEEELAKPSETRWLDQFLAGIDEEGRAFIKIVAVAIDQEER